MCGVSGNLSETVMVSDCNAFIPCVIVGRLVLNKVQLIANR